MLRGPRWELQIGAQKPQKQFVSDAAALHQLEALRKVEVFKAFPIAQGGRGTSTGDPWANSQVKLVHDTRTEQSVVDLAAAFTDQPSDVPLPEQPTQGGRPVQFFLAAYVDGVS